MEGHDRIAAASSAPAWLRDRVSSLGPTRLQSNTGTGLQKGWRSQVLYPSLASSSTVPTPLQESHYTAASCSIMEPLPCSEDPPTPLSPLHDATPVLALVPALEPVSTSSTDSKPAHSVQLYSMRSHTYVHSLTFNSQVLSLKCSCRFIVVALDAQIHAFDATSLQHTFSAVTYAVSAAMHTVKTEGTQARGSSPLALGSAWLAYASNQASQRPCLITVQLCSQIPWLRWRKYVYTFTSWADASMFTTSLSWDSLLPWHFLLHSVFLDRPQKPQIGEGACFAVLDWH